MTYEIYFNPRKVNEFFDNVKKYILDSQVEDNVPIIEELFAYLSNHRELWLWADESTEVGYFSQIVKNKIYTFYKNPMVAEMVLPYIIEFGWDVPARSRCTKCNGRTKINESLCWNHKKRMEYKLRRIKRSITKASN